MLLLDTSFSINGSFIVQIIAWSGGCLMSLIGLFYWIVKTLHREGLNKLTVMSTDIKQIEIDIKPLVVQVAVHTEQIKEIKENLEETNKWIGMHTGEIQAINRKLKSA